jgi:hypothetical protein
MGVKEIKDLIDIRKYLSTIAESSTIPKKEAYQALNLIPFIDKRIMGYILSDEFKDAVGANEKITEPVKSALKK